MSDVRSVVVTHLHPDHYGLAGRVREASGAWIGLHPADAKLLDARYHDTDDLVQRMRELMEMSGVPEGQTARPRLRLDGGASTVSVAQPDILIEDEQVLDLPGWDFRAVWTPGHSPGHICLYSDHHKLLLSGDHVLPRITPNISFHSQQFANPLGDYLESLAKVGLSIPTRSSPRTSTASPGSTRGSTCSSRTMSIAWPKLKEFWRRTPGSPAGTSHWPFRGPDRGTRFTTTCNGRQTGRRWPTSCCWSDGVGCDVSRPSRLGSTWPSSLPPRSLPARTSSVGGGSTASQAHAAPRALATRRASHPTVEATPRDPHPTGNWKMSRSTRPIRESCRQR
jgi:hypothetical protein